MSRRDVKITSKDGQVDVQEARVRKSTGQEVVWFSHDNQGAMVVFASPDGSPFHETHFQVPAGGSVSSGPVVRGAATGKHYKYTVIGPTGVNDPVVIIDN